jgi:hypothetical protein
MRLSLRPNSRDIAAILQAITGRMRGTCMSQDFFSIHNLCGKKLGTPSFRLYCEISEMENLKVGTP